MYLIDTSVWVDFLRGTKTPRVEFLVSLLEGGEASICETVFAEICFGASHEKDFRKLVSYFTGAPLLALKAGWHQEAAQMGFTLRQKGFKPYLADISIALAALHHGVPLLTSDKDFDPYVKLFQLRLA